MDDARARTLRAAGLAGGIGLVGIGGLLWFLGFATVPALLVGGLSGAAFALLVLAAARRADSFEGPTAASPRSPHGHRAAGTDDRSTS